RWDDPGDIAFNLVATIFLAVVLIGIVRAPAERLGQSRWAKVGWVVFAAGLTGMINGLYIPVGAAVAARQLWAPAEIHRSPRPDRSTPSSCTATAPTT